MKRILTIILLLSLTTFSCTNISTDSSNTGEIEQLKT